MPEDWWDALRDKERWPTWFAEMVRWVTSFGFTHMNTLTFGASLTAWEAQRRYCRFLAEHGSSWMLEAVLYAAEPHPKGHGYHIHALWKTPWDSSRGTWGNSPHPLYRIVKRQSEADCLGWSRTWPLSESEPQMAVAYCLKYILKGLKGLTSRRIPMPWDPTEQEPLWGIWTPTTPPNNA